MMTFFSSFIFQSTTPLILNTLRLPKSIHINANIIVYIYLITYIPTPLSSTELLKMNFKVIINVSNFCFSLNKDCICEIKRKIYRYDTDFLTY